MVFMKNKMSKTGAKKIVEEFFSKIKGKSSKDVKKIKKLAMNQNITLGIKKRLYCSKCLHPYIEPGIRIKRGFVNTCCEFCNHIARWKLHMKDQNEAIMPLDENVVPSCAC